jgi:hypothetical protein
MKPVSELVHSVKRSVKIETGKGKKKKTSTKAIDPTKPSQLATVAPWEKESFRELLESPWDRYASVIASFEKEAVYARNYDAFLDNIKEIGEDMWRAKQIALRATQNRLNRIKNVGQPNWQRLNTVRAELALVDLTNESDWDKISDLSPYVSLPSHGYGEEKSSISSIFARHKAGDLREYPKTEALLQLWDSIENSLCEAKSLD